MNKPQKYLSKRKININENFCSFNSNRPIWNHEQAIIMQNLKQEIEENEPRISITNIHIAENQLDPLNMQYHVSAIIAGENIEFDIFLKNTF